MPSQSKLIKQGIYLTDNVFDEIIQRVKKGVKASDTLEHFLSKYKEYTNGNGENNPLVINGYKEKMLDIIIKETNNHKFSRPSQKELVRVTIENRVGDLIVDVGDDIKNSVRDIIKDGYNNNLSQEEIAENITKKVTTIKNKRARAIARTEIARTATASDYVISKGRGANAFTVDCRNTACDKCKQIVLKNPEREASGKGMTGDVEFSIDDVENLPPFHPNSYHKDTQIFTEHGWRYISDLTGDEKLLSLNPDDESLEFIKPVRLFKHKEPQLVHMSNKWFDICVTPDHDCFIHQRRDGGNRGKYFEPQFRKPSDLTSESRFVRCITTDRESPDVININGLEFEPSDFAFFMAWYISEGSVLHDVGNSKKRGYPIFIAQAISENREIIQPVLKNICDYLGLRLNIAKNQFVIYSKELYDYLHPLGHSYEKYIPKEVFTLNKECLNVFLDNYIRGDGHERICGKYNSIERSVYTSSPKLKDDLSYLILLCGFCPSIWVHSKKGTEVEHRNGTYTQNYDIYGIRINTSKYSNYSALTVDVIDYDDYTYCVELPKYHTLWVMRNGKTSWNGNCRCVAMFFKKDSVKPLFSEFKEDENSSDAKPNIKWTEDSIRKKLSGIVDSEDELDNLTTGIWEYMNELENRNEEALSAMGHDYEMYCNQHSINSNKGVDLCPEGIKESNNRGLFFVIHNHPSNNPLHSEGDVIGFAEYNIKYNIVFTEEQGLLIFKNDSAIKEDIITGWKDTYNDMFMDLKKDFSSNYYHIVDLYANGGLKDDEFEELVYKEVINHMSKNVELSIEYFIKNMQEYGVDVTHIMP